MKADVKIKIADEVNLSGIVFSTEEKHEGIHAFLEKRPHRFNKRK